MSVNEMKEPNGTNVSDVTTECYPDTIKMYTAISSINNMRYVRYNGLYKAHTTSTKYGLKDLYETND